MSIEPGIVLIDLDSDILVTGRSFKQDGKGW